MEQAQLFSIDLEAELRKITSRQNLNQYYGLVMLTFHALNHGATAIDIRATREHVEVHLDSNFPYREWQLIATVLSQEPLEVRQSALTDLEKSYGIIYLSLAYDQPQFEIQSGHRSLQVQNRTCSESQNPEPTGNGYRVTFKRTPTHLGKEWHQLAYFCKYSAATITYNGKKLGSPLDLPGQLVLARFENPEGYGYVGIPWDSQMCVLTFYRGGIRLGVKQFEPESGPLYHAVWNQTRIHQGDWLNSAVAKGETYFVDEVIPLYRALAMRFEKLAGETQRIAKQKLLNLPIEYWDNELKQTPIFVNGRGEQIISIAAMEELMKHYHSVPFVPRKHKQAPQNVPFLEGSDMYFARKIFGQTLCRIEP